MAKPTKAQPPPPESFSMGLEQLRMGLLGHARRLHEHIETLADEVEEYNNPDKGTHYGAMLYRHAQIVAELRKHEQGSAGAMTRADLLNAIRKLEANERTSLIREAQAIDAKRSGLA